MATGRPGADPHVLEDLRAQMAAAGSAATAGAAPAPGDPGAGADPLPDGGPAALAWLVRSTSQRPLTQAEARDKLLAKDHPPAVVDAVIDHAIRTRLLDDAGFARAWVQDRGVTRGYGRQRLVRELRRRKVDDAVIDQAVAVLDDHDEVAAATALARARAQRMPATLDPLKVANRLVGFLVRRGYASGLAHQVARTVTATDRDWD